MAKAPNPSISRASSLDAKAWTRAATDVLGDQGIDGVRVEALAKQLGVTKGSFYWHFENRDALLAAVLADWRRRATLGVIERIEAQDGSAENRLRLLMLVPFQLKSDGGGQVELSIRLWARRDPRARSALQEVDELRLRYIASLLREIGFPAERADARAIFAYAFQRVATSLIDRDDATAVERCITELIAL
ncbi:MAG: TetR/AcrR family transcriptional regulator [Pseudomonadota bacterium]|nr:TetR/AcrR family transcriptional regulator [Pseudomonadota bacterium]